MFVATGLQSQVDKVNSLNFLCNAIRTFSLKT